MTMDLIMSRKSSISFVSLQTNAQDSTKLFHKEISVSKIFPSQNQNFLVKADNESGTFQTTCLGKLHYKSSLMNYIEYNKPISMHYEIRKSDQIRDRFQNNLLTKKLSKHQNLVYTINTLSSKYIYIFYCYLQSNFHLYILLKIVSIV